MADQFQWARRVSRLGIQGRQKMSEAELIPEILRLAPEFGDQRDTS